MSYSKSNKFIIDTCNKKKEENQNFFINQSKEKISKIKQLQISQDNQKYALEKLLEDNEEQIKYKKNCQTGQKHIFQNQSGHKLISMKNVLLSKNIQKQIFEQQFDHKIMRTKNVSSVRKMCSEKKMLDSRKFQKVNKFRVFLNHIRKCERNSVEDNYKFFDKNFLKKLLILKNRIFKKNIQRSITEEAKESSGQDKHKSIQQETVLTRNEETVYPVIYEDNNSIIAQDEVINSPIQIKFSQKYKGSNDTKETQNFHCEEKAGDIFKAAKNSFDVGEKSLKSITLNDPEKKIDLDHYSQLSEWSDWNYEGLISKDIVQGQGSKKLENRRLYVFFPAILNHMLRFGKTNIVSESNLQNDSENTFPIVINPEIKCEFPSRCS